MEVNIQSSSRMRARLALVVAPCLIVCVCAFAFVPESAGSSRAREKQHNRTIGFMTTQAVSPQPAAERAKMQLAPQTATACAPGAEIAQINGDRSHPPNGYRMQLGKVKGIAPGGSVDINYIFEPTTNSCNPSFTTYLNDIAQGIICGFDYTNGFGHDAVPAPAGDNMISGKVCETTTSGTICSPNVQIFVADPTFPNFPKPKPKAQQANNCATGCPVNVVTGELWYERQDAALSGPFGLAFRRWYDTGNSHSTADPAIALDTGAGWINNYDISLDLRFASKGSIAFFDDQRHAVYFANAWPGSGAADQEDGARVSVAADSSSYVVTTWGGNIYKFDAGGRLTSITDRVGNQQTINRVPNPYDIHAPFVIGSVTDSLGRSLQFSYDVNARIVGVTSNPAGINIAFTYDSGPACTTGELCKVTESDGSIWSYQYAQYSVAGVTGHYLTKVIDPLGHVAEQNTYTGPMPITNIMAVATQSTDSAQNSLTFSYTSYGNNAPNYDLAQFTRVTDGLGRTTTYAIPDQRYSVVTSVSGPRCCNGGQAMNYSYDGFMRPTSRTDGDGSSHTITYAYGEDTLTQFPTTYGPGAPGGPGPTSYVTMAVPALTAVTEPLGSGGNPSRTTYFSYAGVPGTPLQDVVGLVTLPSVDYLGNTTPNQVVNTYNAAGLLTQQTKQGYIAGVYTYITTNYAYDARGRLTSVSGPRSGEQTSFAYFADGDADAARRGQLQTTTDALSHATSFAGGTYPFNTYDLYGNPKSVADPNGVARQLTYDALGRLLSSTLLGVNGDPANLTTTLTYDATGNLSSVTKPLGNGVAYTYDPNNRLIDSIRFDANKNQQERLHLSYDAMGQEIAEAAHQCASPAPTCASWITAQSETFSYDLLGNLLQITHPVPAGARIAFVYDFAGNVTSVADENHSSPNVSYGYDYANRLISVRQVLSSGTATTGYTYDSLDNLVAVSDPSSNTTTYTFDDFHRMRLQQSPVSGTTSYAYDLDDDLVSSTDANGATTARSYDVLDRILSAASSRASLPSETVTWTYDSSSSTNFGIGKLISMTDPSGSSSFTYERRGLLSSGTKTILGSAYQMVFAYDSNGNRTSLSYPSGRVVAATFDFADRPYSAASGATTFVSSARYAPFGPITSLAYGNGVVQALSYDLRYRPTENKLTPSVGQPLADYLYSQDPVGNITQITDNLNTGYSRTFGYDDLNRLTTANAGANLWGPTGNGYSYDAMGNLKTLQLGPSRVSSFAYTGSLPKLSSVTENGIARAVSYDATGNETQVGSAAYAYSARNLLAAGDGLTYTYNGFGLRAVTSGIGPVTSAPNRPIAGPCPLSVTRYGVRPLCTCGADCKPPPNPSPSPAPTPTPTPLPTPSPTPAGNVRYALYGPELQLLSETVVTAGGAAPPIPIAYEYIWFGDRPVAQVDASGTHWTFADHLGTPLMQTDNTGSITWQAEYEPYGKIWALRTGTAHQPLRLPGQVAEQFDTGANGATERSYNVFRWYRPGWGRYSQTDPIGIDGGHDLFTYVADAPTGRGDKFGLTNYAAMHFVGPGSLAFGYHDYIVIDPCDRLKGDPSYRGSDVITIGAGPTDGYQGFLNSPTDYDKNSPRLDMTEIQPPSGKSADALSQALLDAQANYRNNSYLYYLTPELSPFNYYNGFVGPTYNSNGFFLGILSAVGVNGYRYAWHFHYPFSLDYPAGLGSKVPQAAFGGSKRGRLPCNC